MRHVEPAFLAVCLLISMWINVEIYPNVRARLRPQEQPYLEPGTEISRIQVLDIDERPTLVDVRGERETVVYFMSPTCPWCARNAANVESVASAGYRVIGLVPVAQRSLQIAKSQGFSVYFVEPSTQNALKLRSLPTTILVDREGRVLRSWPGAFGGEKHSQVERYFGVKLPGLLDLQETGAPATAGG